jgi:hypothetical protein
MKKLSEFKNSEMEKSMFKTIFGGVARKTSVRGNDMIKDYWDDANNNGSVDSGDTVYYFIDHSSPYQLT